MELVRIPHRIPDISNGKSCLLQKLSSFYHTVIEQKFLWGFADAVFENLTEIASVQSADRGDIFHGNLILEILFNEY